ncbi:hypothetical protein DM01DRAFT_1336494, partial [Hesseltinella vesiculosa]
MTVPLEIVDRILQHLQPHQLFITATVSGAWYRLSLDILYRYINIRTRHQWDQFMATLQSLALANREAIRVIGLDQRVLICEKFHLDTDLTILGPLCPRLEEFAIVRSRDVFVPASHPATWIRGAATSFDRVNLPLFPFMSCIGTYLGDPTLDRYSAVFDQLTRLALTKDQLLRQKKLQQSTLVPVMFPALQILEVSYDDSASSMHASDLVWLLHHCPCLRHLSLKYICLDNPCLAAAPPAQTSVEYLALSMVEIKSSDWLPLLSSMFPALQATYLDFDFTSGLNLTGGLAQEISDWIIGSRSLTSLRFRRLAGTSTTNSVMERLMDASSNGTWDCQLKHFSVADMPPSYRVESADRFLECNSSAILGSLDSLHLNLSYFYFPVENLLFDQHDLSCSRLCTFPPCNLAPSTLINLTSLRFQKSGDKIKISLNWLLHLCPNLRSATLFGFVVQVDACQLHHPKHLSVKTGLAELAIERCMVIQADAFFSFLQHDLLRLSSLIMSSVEFMGLHPERSLDFGDRRMKLLWFSAIGTINKSWTSLCLEQTQHFRKWTWFSTPMATKHGKLLHPSNREHPFHVRCGLANQVLFNPPSSSSLL